MIGISLELGVVLAGMMAGRILFRRDPKVPDQILSGVLPEVSIIIPARNEAANLPLLLGDLATQTHRPLEILVVDDDSEDETAAIAGSFPVRVLELKDKPRGWLGKTWACYRGARQARGAWLLFLDADVRLAPDALGRLLSTAGATSRAVTVQPYHLAELPHEQLAMVFNLLQVGSTGAAMARPRNLGMFGPLILIPAADYWKAGGHGAVRASIVEDVALGLALKEAGVAYGMYRGDPSIAFRMYAEGIQALIQGWTKNLAAGAARMPLALFFLVFLWISSMTSVAVQVIRYGILGQYVLMVVYGFLYALWVAFLLVWGRRLGSFKLWTILIYPMSLVLFIAVFFRSTLKKLLGMDVVWKGRSIDPRGSS